MKVFDDYVSTYGLDNDKIELKYHHSYRVQALCEAIAKDLQMRERDVFLASLAGLFHDIARFKQISEYHTFLDMNSFDHGDLGAEIFIKEFADNFDLNEEEKTIIYKAIKHHNKLVIGTEVSDEERVFCKIVRDADKIDILNLFSSSPDMLGKTDGNVNEDCRTTFMHKKSIVHDYVTNGTEKNIAILASYWDINYPLSKKIIRDRGYFRKMEAILNNEIYHEYFNLIYKDLEVREC